MLFPREDPYRTFYNNHAWSSLGFGKNLRSFLRRVSAGEPAKVGKRHSWPQSPPVYPGALLDPGILPDCKHDPPSSITVCQFPRAESGPTNKTSILSGSGLNLFTLVQPISSSKLQSSHTTTSLGFITSGGATCHLHTDDITPPTFSPISWGQTTVPQQQLLGSVQQAEAEPM